MLFYVSIHKVLSLTVRTCPLRRDFQKVKKKSVAEEGTTKVDDKENVVPCVTYLPVNRRGRVCNPQTLTFACVCQPAVRCAICTGPEILVKFI